MKEYQTVEATSFGVNPGYDKDGDLVLLQFEGRDGELIQFKLRSQWDVYRLGVRLLQEVKASAFVKEDNS